MLTSRIRLNALVAVLTAFFGLADAQAQVGVTFLNFEGVGAVTDKPTSALCQSVGDQFGDSYRLVYRFTLNPSDNADALLIMGRRSAWRIVSTQSPNFSLAGATTARWDWFSQKASMGSLTGSSSNLTIAPGVGGAISAATGNIKMVGTLNDFLGDAGCTINWHAALVAIPN